MNTTLHPQPAVPVSSDVAAPPPFDIVSTVAHELVGFVVNLGIFLLLAPILVLTLSPLVVIVSGGEILDIDVAFWELSVAVTVVLCGHSFLAGIQGKPDRDYRLAVQWMFWAILIFCLYTLGFWSVVCCLVKTVSDAGVMAVAAVIGDRFARLRKPKEEKKTGLFGIPTDEELCTLAKKGELQPPEIRREQVKRMALQSIGAMLLIFPILALIAGAAIGSQYLTKYAEQVRYVGKPAPAATFVTAGDEPWSLEEHRGKVILLEYWKPDSGPCRAAFPHLKEIHGRFASHQDFVMASVSCGDKEQSVDWFDSQQAGWHLLFLGKASEAGFQPKSIPESPTAYLIDRDGTVTTVSAAIYSYFDHAPPIGPEDAATLEETRCAEIERELERLLTHTLQRRS